MRVLLDAHAVLWGAMADDRLPQAVRAMIDDPRSRLVVSVATTWEVTLKALKGRLRLPDPPSVFFDGLVHDAQVELLPIEQRHVAALPELPQIHDDPFDRMLVAQALVEDLDVVSGDERIRAYPIRTIW